MSKKILLQHEDTGRFLTIREGQEVPSRWFEVKTHEHIPTTDGHHFNVFCSICFETLEN